MNSSTPAPVGWARVDELDAVRTGLIGRDRVYALCREGRIPHVRISKRTLLVKIDFLERMSEGLALDPRPEPPQ